MKNIKGFIMVFVIAILLVISSGTQKAEAASKYIDAQDFIKYIVEQMEWEIDEKSEQPYIDVAIEKGIVKKGDFKDYSAYLTRTDAAVIANRLDEYINLKYGYSQEVYEFLRDCNLFEGRLFYSTEGSLYPEGGTRETYPEGEFHEEVVLPILGEYFQDDNWRDKGLRTGYKYITDGEANILKRYMEIGLVPDNRELLVVDSFDKKSDVIKAWNIIKDGDRQVSAVLEHRISDIKSIPKAKREAVASIVAKGIIKGYSNGMYIQNREFRGKNKITAKGAKDVIQMVLNPEKRAQVSPDGQLIRTTKLPKNASDYKYILECFPNKYYEMNHSFMYLTDYLSGEIREDEYAYPKKIDYNYLYDKFYYNKMKLDMDKYKYYDEAISNVEEYLQHIFDVDYRTVNNKWKEGLASSIGFNNRQESIYESIDRYVENIKKNHTVVELGRIAIDPGAIYESRDYLYVRVYVKYRITADDMSVPTSELIYGPNTIIKNIEKGEWKETIFDVFVDCRYKDNVYKWAPPALMSLTDWFYRDSFK